MEYDRAMSGWGRVVFSIGLGLLVVAGCGGRTGTLEDEYGGGAENSGAQGGSVSRSGSGPGAGRPSRGGTGNLAGNAGASIVGGYGYGGYGGYGYAGYGGYGYAGYGGYGYAGAVIYPSAGYAGYPIGGGYPVAGYGGYAVGGGFPGGGYAGQAPVDCLQCIGQSCSAQLITCFQDFGCLSIFDCMQSTGCQAFQCYTDQYCRTTIDQWGGPNGAAMSELLQTFTCALQAGCQCD
jgi:hypothetical protein